MTQGEVGKKIFQAIDAKGVLPLAWGENAFCQLSKSKKVISTLKNLKGLKIRTVGSPLFFNTLLTPSSDDKSL
jgi:TRAP-type transport system periplasmic protein